MKLFKKFLIGALAATAIISLAACGKANNNKNDDDQGGQKVVYDQTVSTASVSFSFSERLLTVGDTFLLEPQYEKIDGYSMEYSSSAPDIVSVDKNTGLIKALNAGSATVKAKYSNGRKSASASVNITCDFGAYKPEVKLLNVVAEDGLKLRVGSSFALNAGVNFNSVLFEDGTYKYEVADTSVATVSGGKIVGVAAGETFLSITGTWRGQTVRGTVDVTVSESVVFYNDGEVIQDVSIYTVAEAGGNSYVNYISNNFTANVSGNVSDNVKLTIADRSVAALSSDGTRIEGKAFGETKVTLSATAGGEEISMSFNITVLRPEVEVKGQIKTFATDYGTYLDPSSKTGARKTVKEFIGTDEEIVDAYQNDKAITVSGDKIFGVKTTGQNGRSSVEIVVGTNTYLYRVQLEALAKYFTVAQDLKELEIKGTSDLGGYYELLNDIDATGISLSHGGSGSFTGTFDGNGHTISNLTVEAGQSMFGSLKTSTIKNLALVDLNATKANFFSQASRENGLNFSNIYIKVSASTEYPKGMLSYSGSQNSLKNVVIEYTGSNTALTDYNSVGQCGVLCNGLSRAANANGTEVTATDNPWSDVYVISPFVLTYDLWGGFVRNTDKPANTSPMLAWGANEAKDKNGNDTSKTIWLKDKSGSYVSLTDLIAAKKVTVGDMVFASIPNDYTPQYFNYKFHNVYHYDDSSALISDIASKKDADGKLIPASTTLASFDSAYWDISSGAPVWVSK